MKNISIYLLFVVTIVALFGFAFSYSQSDGTDGQQIFVDNNCLKCHSVESLELVSTGKNPSDLSEIGGTYENDFLSKYLMKEETIDDKKHKMPFKGTEDDLNKLVDGWQTLKSESSEEVQ